MSAPEAGGLTPAQAESLASFAEAVESYASTTRDALHVIADGLNEVREMVRQIRTTAVTHGELRLELATIHAELAEVRDALQAGP